MEVPSNSSFYSFLKKTFSKNSIKKLEEQIELRENELLNNLEDYFNTTIREVMVPRTEMITIDKSQHIKEVIKLIQKYGHSRLPVQDEKPDNIVGILYTVDLFKYFDSPDDVIIANIMRKPLYVSYSQQIHQLLSNFRSKRVQLAIVIDEHGGVDGLVTMEDVFEKLVGEIPDELNKNLDPSYKSLSNNMILMDANFTLSHFNELYNTNFQKEGIETIGGYICHKAGKIPEQGETIKMKDLSFIVDESNERRLEKLRITAPKSKIS